MSALQKNKAGQTIAFSLVNASTGAAFPGAVFTGLAFWMKDGTQAGFAGTFTEPGGTGNGNGQYYYTPTQSESNCTNWGLLIKPASAVAVGLGGFTTVADPTDLGYLGIIAAGTAGAFVAGTGGVAGSASLVLTGVTAAIEPGAILLIRSATTGAGQTASVTAWNSGTAAVSFDPMTTALTGTITYALFAGPKEGLVAEASAVPTATDTLTNKLNFLTAITRNKITQTATTQVVRNDGDSGTIATSTVSDDGTTFTRGKFA